jgi:hypothetical protein
VTRRGCCLTWEMCSSEARHNARQGTELLQSMEEVEGARLGQSLPVLACCCCEQGGRRGAGGLLLEEEEEG